MKGIQLIGRYSGCVLGQPTYVASSECTFFKANGIEYRLCNTDNAPYREVDCGIAVTRYYERTNCPGSKRGPDEDWEVARSCPADMVATGMKLSTRNGGGQRRMIDGIALECHRLSG